MPILSFKLLQTGHIYFRFLLPGVVGCVNFHYGASYNMNVSPPFHPGTAPGVQQGSKFERPINSFMCLCCHGAVDFYQRINHTLCMGGQLGCMGAKLFQCVRLQSDKCRWMKIPGFAGCEKHDTHCADLEFICGAKQTHLFNCLWLQLECWNISIQAHVFRMSMVNVNALY